MERKVFVKTTVLCTFDEKDIQDYINLKEQFKEYLGEAKRKVAEDPNNYDALVDVNFYRLTIRKFNELLNKIRHGKTHVIEKRNYYSDSKTKYVLRKETR